jgi:hypothetical protein
VRVKDALDRLIATMARGGAGGSGRAGIMGNAENASKLAFNEFGTVTAPARPTVRPAFDERELGDLAAASIDRQLGEESIDARATVGGLALDLEIKIKENIKSNTPPPLAQSTIDKRIANGNTSTATLIDTGEMLAAVSSAAKWGAAGWGESEVSE